MLLPAENLWGTLRPLREKGAAGFGHLMECRGKSRMEPPRSAALFICASSFMVARWEGASPAGFREVPRLTNPSSHRPRLVTGALVFANRNLWRPFMAHRTPPHVCGTPTSYQLRVIDALGDIEYRLLALEAVEALISPQKAGNTEDLNHVSRTGLGVLLTILNCDMRQCLATAQERAEAALQAAREGGQ